MAGEEAVLEGPARVEDAVEALADEELVLLAQLGVVALVPARPRDVQAATEVVVGRGALARLGLDAHSASSMRSTAVLNALPVTS